MITEDDYKLAVAQKEAANKTIKKYHQQKMTAFEERWKRFIAGEQFFVDDELRYAAYARCGKCGEGLAYPNECSLSHYWSCSNELKGKISEKHPTFPFAYYEIKYEDQPSANGATTRPSA